VQCAHCRGGFHPSDIEVDHIRRLADGGHDSAHNIQLLCTRCHRIKSAKENRAR